MWHLSSCKMHCTSWQHPSPFMQLLLVITQQQAVSKKLCDVCLCVYVFYVAVPPRCHQLPSLCVCPAQLLIHHPHYPYPPPTHQPNSLLLHTHKHTCLSFQRPPAKRGPAVVSLAFTGLALAPLAVLVIYLGTLGVNLKVREGEGAGGGRREAGRRRGKRDKVLTWADFVFSERGRGLVAAAPHDTLWQP